MPLMAMPNMSDTDVAELVTHLLNLGHPEESGFVLRAMGACEYAGIHFTKRPDRKNPWTYRRVR